VARTPEPADQATTPTKVAFVVMCAHGTCSDAAAAAWDLELRLLLLSPPAATSRCSYAAGCPQQFTTVCVACAKDCAIVPVVRSKARVANAQAVREAQIRS
jgi:hypothetical protein